MAPQSAGFMRRWQSQGMEYLEPEQARRCSPPGRVRLRGVLPAPPHSLPHLWQAVAALLLLLEQPETARGASVGVFPVLDWSRFAASSHAPDSQLTAALIRTAGDTSHARNGSAVPNEPTPNGKVASAQQASGHARTPAADPRSYMQRLVLQAFAEVTDGAACAPSESLVEAGIDSLASVDFTAKLSASLGTELPGSLVFDYPIAIALAGHLATLVASVGSEASSPLEAAAHPPHNIRASMSALPPQVRPDEVALLGSSCCLPPLHRATPPFWAMLCASGSAIGAVPTERWDASALVHPDQNKSTHGFTYTSAGAWLDATEMFDFAFFGIAKAEAAAMDPKQRLLLEVGYEALHGDGRTKEGLMGEEVGVFVGLCSQDWQLIAQHHRPGPYTGTGCHGPSIVANRLSYVLGLRGASLVVDTACSSSLVAASAALDNLHRADMGAALVAGVNLCLTHHMFVAFSCARMLSPTGRNATFDASCDGYVRGEGCIATLITTQPAGREQLTLAASAINQDGRSATLTAPNGPAQQACVRRALAAKGASAAELAAIEAHGSATPLGDVIEVEALAAVLRGSARSGPLPLGSGKTAVGHLEGAAGALGLLKAAASMLHARQAPLGGLGVLNPAFGAGCKACAFPAQLLAHERRAKCGSLSGTSSFGFGGTNAHVSLRLGPGAPPNRCSVAHWPTRRVFFSRQSLPWWTQSTTTAVPAAFTPRPARAVDAEPPAPATVAAAAPPPLPTNALFETKWEAADADGGPTYVVVPARAWLLALSRLHSDLGTPKPFLGDGLGGDARAAAAAWCSVVHRGDNFGLVLCAGNEAHGMLSAVIELMKKLTQGAGDSRVLLLTVGSQALSATEPVVDAAAAGVWGFARALRLEHPRFPLGMLDLPAAAFAAAAAADPSAADRAWLVPVSEAEVAFTAEGAPHVLRLTRSARTLAAGAAPEGAAAGAHLVSGGMGGLGLVCARWLVDAGALLALRLRRSRFALGVATPYSNPECGGTGRALQRLLPPLRRVPAGGSARITVAAHAAQRRTLGRHPGRRAGRQHGRSGYRPSLRAESGRRVGATRRNACAGVADELLCLLVHRLVAWRARPGQLRRCERCARQPGRAAPRGEA